MLLAGWHRFWIQKKNLVELPNGEDLNEWLAVNTIEFYNEISILYGTLIEFCTPELCPTMSAGPKSYTFLYFLDTSISGLTGKMWKPH
jgi:hypothetical protein